MLATKSRGGPLTHDRGLQAFTMITSPSAGGKPPTFAGFGRAGGKRRTPSAWPSGSEPHSRTRCGRDEATRAFDDPARHRLTPRFHPDPLEANLPSLLSSLRLRMPPGSVSEAGVTTAPPTTCPRALTCCVKSTRRALTLVNRNAHLQKRSGLSTSVATHGFIA